MSIHQQHYTNEARKALAALQAHNAETRRLLAAPTAGTRPMSFWDERTHERDNLRARLEAHVELLLGVLP